MDSRRRLAAEPPSRIEAPFGAVERAFFPVVHVHYALFLSCHSLAADLLLPPCLLDVPIYREVLPQPCLAGVHRSVKELRRRREDQLAGYWNIIALLCQS